MHRRSTLGAALCALLVLALAAVGCGGTDGNTNGSAAPIGPSSTGTGANADQRRPSGDITVLAASSLTDAFTALARAFESANPGTSVRLSFGASSTLAAQITHGAPADVFASADTTNMAKVADARALVGAPVPFATNSLEIIVSRGNPRAVRSLADLAAPGLVVVTCSPQVPIGAYTQQVLGRAHVSIKPKSYEADVKGIVNKVLLGEADAGLVYATDVRAAGDKAEGVAIDPVVNVSASYPVAATKTGRNTAGGEAFVAFVTGADGRRILGGFGFGAP
jgi:molybdate transport system substrate-binding protein